MSQTDPAALALQPLLHQVANTYNLPVDLLTAQVGIESAFNPFALRYEPAYFERYIQGRPEVPGFRYGPLAACSFGLLQILLETAIELGFDDRPERLFVPQVGLAWGAKYLQHCLVLTNQDYGKALARYNGTGTAARLYAERVYQAAGRSL